MTYHRLMTRSIKFRHDRIKKRREELGISQDELAEILRERFDIQIKQAGLSHIEVGRKFPSIPLLGALIQVLETNGDFLFDLTEKDLPAEGLEDEFSFTVRSAEEKALFHELFELLRKKPAEEQRLVLDLVRLIVPKPPRIIGE